MNKLNVTVNGTVYEVILESSGAAAAAAAPAAEAPKAPAGASQIVSPLAGLMVAVHATIGQTVKEGDKVFTLEAMKMNTFVTADKSGTVSAIHVKAGDAITEGQALLSLS
jgi:biotin carboxyl carrier protein